VPGSRRFTTQRLQIASALLVVRSASGSSANAHALLDSRGATYPRLTELAVACERHIALPSVGGGASSYIRLRSKAARRVHRGRLAKQGCATSELAVGLPTWLIPEETVENTTGPQRQVVDQHQATDLDGAAGSWRRRSSMTGPVLTSRTTVYRSPAKDANLANMGPCHRTRQ
jgi:hypothetical protein